MCCIWLFCSMIISMFILELLNPFVDLLHVIAISVTTTSGPDCGWLLNACRWIGPDTNEELYISINQRKNFCWSIISYSRVVLRFEEVSNRALPNPVDYYIASFVSISHLKVCYPTQSVVVNTALEIPHNTVNSSSVECDRQVIWIIVQLVQCGLHDEAITIILPFIVHVGLLLELLLCGCFCLMLCFIRWIQAARVIEWILC